MRKQVFVLFVFVPLLCCVPCFGQDKTIRNATDLVALKARVAEAKARSQRLVVKVEPSLMDQKQLPLEQTGRASFTGKVVKITDQSFVLWEKSKPSSDLFVTINYSSVLSLKKHSHVIAFLKSVGDRALIVGFSPVYIVAGSLGLLPDC